MLTIPLLSLVLATGAGRAPSSDAAEEWRADLEFLRSELRRVHPRFKDCALPAELDARFAALSRDVEGLPDGRITVEVQRLLASVGDGHTLVWPFGMKRGSWVRLPVLLWEFEEGLHVVDAADPRHVGKRVLRIGDLPAEEVLRRLAGFISHDNEMQIRWAAPFYATLTDFLLAIGATRDRTTATLALDGGLTPSFSAEAVDPDRLEEKLIAARTAPAPAYLARRGTPYWLEELEDGALYVQVNSMSDGEADTLADFGRALRPRLSKVPRLVLDLRLNNGGEASKSDELFRTLVSFDTAGGRLAVLVGRMTFSAAMTFATRLDQWTSAVFVGEPTGSRPNHFGNEHPFKLPKSGLRGSISSGLNQPVTARDERTAITPEVLVPLRAADYFRGSDPALEAARRAIAR